MLRKSSSSVVYKLNVAVHIWNEDKLYILIKDPCEEETTSFDVEDHKFKMISLCLASWSLAIIQFP